MLPGRQTLPLASMEAVPAPGRCIQCVDGLWRRPSVAPQTAPSQSHFVSSSPAPLPENALLGPQLVQHLCWPHPCPAVLTPPAPSPVLGAATIWCHQRPVLLLALEQCAHLSVVRSVRHLVLQLWPTSSAGIQPHVAL